MGLFLVFSLCFYYAYLDRDILELNILVNILEFFPKKYDTCKIIIFLHGITQRKYKARSKFKVNMNIIKIAIPNISPHFLCDVIDFYNI